MKHAPKAGLKNAAKTMQGHGRNGDSVLAHINPGEAAHLKRMGGAGTRNPKTGLLEFGGYEGEGTDMGGGYEGGGNEVGESVSGSAASHESQTYTGDGGIANTAGYAQRQGVGGLAADGYTRNSFGQFMDSTAARTVAGLAGGVGQLAYAAGRVLDANTMAGWGHPDQPGGAPGGASDANANAPGGSNDNRTDQGGGGAGALGVAAGAGAGAGTASGPPAYTWDPVMRQYTDTRTGQLTGMGTPQPLYSKNPVGRNAWVAQGAAQQQPAAQAGLGAAQQQQQQTRPLDTATRDSIIAQARALGQQQGISPEQALYNYAQTQGLSNTQIDTMMGFGAGATDSWLRSQQRTSQPAAPAAGATGGGYNDVNGTVVLGADGRAVWQDHGASTGSAVKPLDAATRKAAIDQAVILGKQQGISPEQALYNYGKAQGLSNTEIDTVMGFSTGSADSWERSQQRTSHPVNNTPAQQPTNQQPTFQQNNLGMGTPQLQQYQKNPYLDEMAQGITSQMNDNWSRNIAPGIRSGAMNVGGFGGSRQGVVESNALNDMNRSLGKT